MSTRACSALWAGRWGRKCSIFTVGQGWRTVVVAGFVKLHARETLFVHTHPHAAQQRAQGQTSAELLVWFLMRPDDIPDDRPTRGGRNETGKEGSVRAPGVPPRFVVSPPDIHKRPGTCSCYASTSVGSG